MIQSKRALPGVSSARALPAGDNPGAQSAPPPRQAIDPQWDADVANPARRVCFFFAVGLIFIRFSMIHEALGYYLQVNLYLLYIFGPPALLGVVLTGGLRRLLRGRAPLYWLGFTAWMAVAAVFSEWPGGSVPVWIDYVKTQLPVMLIMGGLIMTWKECVVVTNTIALASIVTLFFGQLSASHSTGRLALEMQGGSIANSNDYAAHMILVLPFLLAFGLRQKANIVTRLAVFAAIAFGLFLILQTASRGALLSLVVMSLLALVYATSAQRFAVMVAVPVLAVALFAGLPSQTRERLMNFSTTNDPSLDEAAGSTQNRTYLLRQSIRFALQNPLTGIGPGLFSSHLADRSREEGEVMSQNAHNSYAQAAAENGIPALLFYLAAIAASFRLIKKTFNRARALGSLAKDIQLLAFFFMLAFVGFFTAIFFLNFYDKFYPPALGGFIVAFAIAAEKEISRRQQMQAVPAGTSLSGAARFARLPKN